jgi:hypothetical protein
MDRELWSLVRAAVRRAARAVRRPPGRRRPVYPGSLIATMYLWSVLHDRCLSWACDRAHYGALLRPRGRLPSVSQFTRRVKDESCRAILQHVHGQLAACGAVAWPTGYFDGRALAVGPASKDPQARRARVCGTFLKGYKLHAFVDERRRVRVWSVTPLNWPEPHVAEALCAHLPAPASRETALVLADAGYDSHRLYRGVAHATGAALLTPLRGRRLAGRGRGGRRHAKTLRKMGPQRRAAVALWRDHAPLARHVSKARNNVEGVFSVLSVALGLGATLPAFVRRLDRVRRWVGAKIILYHARLLALERLAATHAA